MSDSHRCIRLTLLLSYLLLTLAPWPASAQPWSAKLQDGGRLSVDADTRRATILRDGVESQAWDGVHRLEDGSVVTIRAGQVVPSADLQRAQRQPDTPRSAEQLGAEVWVGAPIVGDSPCESLVRRVCGEKLECADSEACPAVRKLLETEEQERATNNNAKRMTHASGQCQEADRDRKFFVTCGL